jgi:hypothetical protein
LEVSPELLVSGNPGCTLQIQAKLAEKGGVGKVLVIP